MNRTWKCALSAFLLFASCASYGLEDGTTEPIELAVMELHLGASTAIPMSADDWDTVGFPDLWYWPRRRIAAEGWYRGTVELPPQAVTEQLAVYVPGHSGKLSVYWDGELIGHARPSLGEGIPKAAGPFIQILPDSLAAPGRHTLHIRFQGSPGMLDFLRAPVVGPYAELLDAYMTKRYFTRDIPVGFGLLSVLASLLILSAYLRDPSAPGVGWAAVGILLSAFALLLLYFPLPGAFTDAVRITIWNTSILCLVLALHRIRAVARRVLEPVLFATWMLFAIATLSVPFILTGLVGLTWWWLSVSVGIYGVVQFILHARELERTGWIVMIFGVACAAMVLHDIHGLFNRGVFLADQALILYIAPSLGFALIGMIVLRARRFLATTLALNAELEARVEEKHAELQDNYERLAESQRREAAALERARLMRDMHDGLGGQLVHALGLSEQARNPELKSALRFALDDLRLIIDSLAPEENTLQALFASYRHRTTRAINRQGIALNWALEELTEDIAISPEHALGLMRIVQEAVTNAVRHARCDTITIRAIHRDAQLTVEVCDDGHGIVGNRRGRGLANMEVRAKEIGGALHIDSSPEGSTVRCVVQLDNQDPPLEAKMR